MAVHCDVHCSVHCPCTVRALCKTRCLCPLIFSSAERCNSASGGVQAHSTLVHHARHTALISNFAHMRSKCCNVASLFVGSSSEDESVFGLGFWHVQREFVQACVCTSINEENKSVASLFGG